MAVIRQHKASANPPSANVNFQLHFVKGVVSMLKLWFQAQILSPKIVLTKTCIMIALLC